MLDQHATGLYVVHRVAYRPDGHVVVVKAVTGTVLKPPAATILYLTRTVTTKPDVVVDIRSTEHHPVCAVRPQHPDCYRIPGVSAVSGHTQLILTSLITDGERRVFCRVPQTAGTLDLSTATRHSRMYVTDVMDIAQRISGFRNRLEVALKVFMQKEKLSTSKMKSGAKEDNNEMIIWSFALYAAV